MEGPADDATLDSLADITADSSDDTTTITAEDFIQSDVETNIIANDPTLTTKEKLDKIFNSYSTMGASIAVIENGEITFTYVYGLRQKGGLPVTEDTAFQVGSIGKMVAGIGVMQLLEETGTALDADIGSILGIPIRNPQYPATPITLRQIMTHTAGLRDSGPYKAALQGNGKPLSDVFSGSRQHYAFYSGFESGTDVLYSNFGGGLAGSVIEALSGQTLDDYMKENVFEPLGITAGYQAALLPKEVPLADMYTMPQRYVAKVLRDDPTCITEPDPQLNYYLTAGKLIISAPDMAKLLIALCDGGMQGGVRILRESSVAEMRTRQNHRGTVSCESGRGLYMNIIENDQVQGRVMYGHGGKANGMLCAAYFDPVDRTGVVMLTNGCLNKEVYNGVGMLGRAVMRICYGELIDPQHVVENPFLVE